jgi:hypothetical protein
MNRKIILKIEHKELVCDDVNLIQLAQDYQWRALVNTVINIRVA